VPALRCGSRRAEGAGEGERLCLREGRGNLYEREFGSSTDRQLTDFVGRSGYLGRESDTDGEFLYFTWSEDHGDLWVMDVDKDP